MTDPARRRSRPRTGGCPAWHRHPAWLRRAWLVGTLLAAVPMMAAAAGAGAGAAGGPGAAATAPATLDPATIDSAAAIDPAAIDAAAAAVGPAVVAWRRDIHQHPELSNRETRTAAIVAAHLRGLGVEVRTGIAHTGVVGILRGGRPGHVIALRADMDALPVEERTGLPFASTLRSTHEGQDVGVMHACGHDNHVAILLGAAEVLAGLRTRLAGTIVFIFQPAEEGAPRGEDGGAGMMVREGVLADPLVEAIFGLHVMQHLATGQVGHRARGFMASAQRFDVVVSGRQTHGSTPWAGSDPVVAAAQVVTAAQTVISRRTDLTAGPAVVTFGVIRGGVRDNIIPDEVVLSGTIRTFDEAVRARVHDELTRTVEHAAAAAGATATITIDAGVPVTWNDPALTARTVPTLRRVFGTANVVELPPITGAEDFAFFQQAIPGLYVVLGVRPPAVPASAAVSNHSPLFDADEAALVPGVRLMSHVAVDWLRDGPGGAAAAGGQR